MAGLNKVMLIGRLGKDPEVISFESGGKKMTVTLATSERYRDRDGNWQDQTEWHNVVAWGNLAADIAEGRRNYVKGDMLFIEGRIKTRQYQDSQGVTKYITEIIAERMNLLTKSNPGGEQKHDYPHASETKNTFEDTAFNTPAAPEDDLPF